jgi:hypothetical protein
LGGVDLTLGGIDLRICDLDLTPGDLFLSEGSLDLAPGDVDRTSGGLFFSRKSLDSTVGDVDLRAGDVDLRTGDVDLTGGGVDLFVGDLDRLVCDRDLRRRRDPGPATRTTWPPGWTRPPDDTPLTGPRPLPMKSICSGTPLEVKLLASMNWPPLLARSGGRCLLLTIALIPGACGAPLPPPPPVVTILPAPVLAAVPAPGPCDLGCIGDSTIPATAANRAVIAFCESYRRAVMERDLPRLLSMASPRYLDAGGTPDPSDDVDRESLESFLEREIAQSRVLEYKIRYLRIRREGAKIRVDYHYRARFKLDGVSPERLNEEDAELDLEESDSALTILSGM